MSDRNSLILLSFRRIQKPQGIRIATLQISIREIWS